MRGGYAQYATGLPGRGETILPYVTGSASLNRLFVACNDGNIYDITSSGIGPWTPSLATPGMFSPGRFTWANFDTVTQHYLCICGAGMGYATYDGTAWLIRVEGTNAGEVDIPGSATLAEMDGVFSWK